MSKGPFISGLDQAYESTPPDSVIAITICCSCLPGQRYHGRKDRQNGSNRRSQVDVTMLTAKQTASFSIVVMPLDTPAPDIPAGVPGSAPGASAGHCGAERAVAAVNAQIGIARSAYFPVLTLSGRVGFSGLTASDWLTWPSRVWAAGPDLAATIFDAGLRRATVHEPAPNTTPQSLLTVKHR